MKKPLIVGITGGIGGGKSTLARLLREKGYHVYDTDLEARRLQNENSVIHKQLTELFGGGIYQEGKLDRKFLGNIVFENPDLLQNLNKIVHPVVKKDFFEWQTKYPTEKFLFVESAILFESGFNEFVDKVIVVTAPENVRIQRVVKRDDITAEAVKARMENQMPENEKVSRADILINSGGKNALINKFSKLIAELDKYTTD